MTCIAVCGPAQATAEEAEWAAECGRNIALAGAVLVCGGLGGVMDAAAKGSSEKGGVSIGLLPGETASGASSHLSAAIPTGLGEARNFLVARAADVIIAISGEFGTLSEIAIALKIGKPVVGLRTWKLSKEGLPAPDPILRAADPARTVELALEAAGRA